MEYSNNVKGMLGRGKEIKMVNERVLSSTHLQRLKQLEQHFGHDKAYDVDISFLADILHCSERNVSKLMASLDSRGVINWRPGSGRGRRSQLTVLKTFKVTLLSQLEIIARRGNINRAFQLATQFEQQNLFQEWLPYWSDSAKNELRKQNTLMYLVPYNLPEWRPHLAQSSRSIILIESLFDTLVKFDPEQQKIIPHVAHQFYYEDNKVVVRLRNDVTMHNGEPLTAELVKTNLEMRRDTPHPYQLLFRHLKSIETRGQWVIFHMCQFDPIFIHLLADSHTAIFDFNASAPIGSGPYQIERVETKRWSLIRNRRYFGLGGHIERAMFWSSDSTPDATVHVAEHPYFEDQLGKVEDIDHSGCTVLQFHHHSKGLSLKERAWIVHHCRKFIGENNMDAANSIMPTHQKKGFHLFNQEMSAPHRPIKIAVKDCHEMEVSPLLDALAAKGVAWQLLDKEQTDVIPDLSYDCYVFSDDLAFQYYEWLLSGEIFTLCLPEKSKQSLLTFINMLMQESDDSQDFLYKLYRAEDWLIQNYYYCPLWRNHFSVSRADNLYGTETSNMGVMSLVKMWLED
ncbi:SgrR family transcriptional regulator [Salinivibrio kushneri]|uniref:SgrR family transcriptional regulator n=1 Tax=Salinivibrio kushneri TaxID=1908198 RepID=A0AA47KJY6_9GAMM|nr:SgrR family transcriptional regulator [Salinivibrio kushneri]WBA08198.1 SgrR family transcriptional regulator [Salinivibrio kushneri]